MRTLTSWSELWIEFWSEVSPKTLLWLSAIAVLALSVAMTRLALRAPELSSVFRLSPVSEAATPASGAAVKPELQLQRNSRHWESIHHFTTPSGSILAYPELLIEEPDTLEGYSRYNAFMQDQRKLAKALQQGELVAVTTTGETIPISGQHRRLGDLPFLYWFQLLVGAAGALTGAAVLCFGQQSMATRLYALTGLGYILFAPSAAVYSTRDLILDGSLFRGLSIMNHFGALFFTGCLAGLLWSYPSRLSPRVPIPLMTISLSLVCWAVDALQWWPDSSFFHLSVLALFVLGIAFAVAQWIRHRKNPLNRAAFRWFLLSIMLGTGLFASLVIIPAALGWQLEVSQAWMFGAFLIMYWGLSLGLLRYRLFDLESWWFSIWAWFLSGLAILVLDIALLSWLSLSSEMALALAIALTGWLYFPLRQKALSLLQLDQEQALTQWLPEVLPLLLSTRPTSDQENQLRQRWAEILTVVFRPLYLESGPATTKARLEDSGQTLLVPDVRMPGQSLSLHHAAQGQRLFRRQDLVLAGTLQELAELAFSIARARDTGAKLERERIARDIHDDMGARLLALLQHSSEAQRPLIRELLDDMRHLLSSLDDVDVPLVEAIASWRVEASSRLSKTGIRLDWQAEVDEVQILTAFEYHHLTRILRESITNALKHAQSSVIAVQITSSPQGQLRLQIHNDHPHKAPSDRGGRGMQNMKRRVQSLHGKLEWQQDSEYRLSITVQLNEMRSTSTATPQP